MREGGRNKYTEVGGMDKVMYKRSEGALQSNVKLYLCHFLPVSPEKPGELGEMMFGDEVNEYKDQLCVVSTKQWG